MKILVLAPYLPFPPGFGGAVRIYHLIRQLARRHEVHLLCFREGDTDPADEKGLAPFCRSITLVPRNVAHKRRRQLQSLFGRRSFQRRFHWDRAMQAAIDRLCRERHPDLILVEFAQMAGYRFPPALPVVLDEHNVEFDLLERMAARQSGWARRVFNRIEAAKFRREELAAARQAALVLTTSSRDAALLGARIPGLGTRVITNGVDCDYFACRAAAPRRPAGAVFTGATHYFPNEDALLFFALRIQDHLVAMCPDFHLTAVGGRPRGALAALRSERFELTGFVDDVRPYMWQASVFVVPLRMGGGTRFKIVEAMAAGVPVVSTRIGAEGLPVTHGRELLLADDPRDFAEAVARVLSDPRLADALAQRGLWFVRKHFDWSVVGDRLHDALAPLERAV